jgi:NAD(P)-dependent dehydrogenase (short-subunit alcohol dehydrogenase family)
VAKLDSKRVVVTGAAGGIGGAAIRLFTELGARVACTYHTTPPRLPPGVLSERCNVADRGEVMRAFDAIASRLGGIDVLLHTAGLHGSRSAEEIDETDWDRMFDANGKATVWTNQAAFRHMRAHGGSIINMGSVEGVRGFAGNAVYAASRGAVMAWTRSIALEWGQYGIRVNCVAPAVVTDIFRRQCESLDEATLEAVAQDLARRIPLGGRLGDPLSDLAPVLAFLASEDSRFITGQTLAVDGGLMMLGS